MQVEGARRAGADPCAHLLASLDWGGGSLPNGGTAGGRLVEDGRDEFRLGEFVGAKLVGWPSRNRHEEQGMKQVIVSRVAVVWR